ncbi:helix-turn-helix transcriptional regulator [Serratia sp. N21D137]|uniref:helix-turn-helix transcriptional regulator n=1 Tax=Serratia sp. N21D137 TaxID=3397495 RepID=UPI0039E1A516
MSELNFLPEVDGLYGTIKDNGTITLSYDSHIKNINYYIVTDNMYFSLGVVKYIENILNKISPRKLNAGISIQCYLSGKVLSVYEDIHRNAHLRKTSHVIIADKDFIRMLGLGINEEISRSVSFISCEDCNLSYFEKMLKSNNATHSQQVSVQEHSSFWILNQREKRICFYLYNGFTPTFIGSLLGINSKTVSYYRMRIMKKIGCERKGDFNKALINYYGNKSLRI